MGEIGMGVTIRCQGLTKRFGEVTAVNNLNLDIPAGAIFGFLGRNGAGKTTTIRLLTGLAQPTGGTAWVNGHDMAYSSAKAQQQFGYLPQDPAFYNWMTPVEYLSYVADLFQMPKPQKQVRIDDMLTLVGLQDATKRKIGGFSGGMQQRLGIAQAMLHDPPVLFLDEPTNALDPAGRYEVLSLIESLRGRVTVFLSSHILGDVERVCDTIGMIQKGELVLVENRDALLARFATDVVSIEIDRSSLDGIPPFAAAAAAQPWVTAVTDQHNQLRITVNDKSTAMHTLLALAVEHKLAVKKYEWIRPSLEEIFLQIETTGDNG
ncbi:MAG: ABC transporter ATP-binding protein [Anaerolineales bacterium]|nr:ABC transporter ATP-binding protein [Anaerolineales bacterium]